MQERPVGIVILAAGASHRMGQPKQLLAFGGGTLLRRAVEAAIGSVCRPIVVVIGAHAELIEPEVQSLPVVIAHNADWSEGMSSSLRVGVERLMLETGEAEGVVITLVDQPLVSSADIDHLVEVHRLSGRDIVASRYAGTQGVPAFIAARFFAELRELAGAGGAKMLIHRYADHVASVPLVTGAVDIDTPADYDSLIRL